MNCIEYCIFVISYIERPLMGISVCDMAGVERNHKSFFISYCFFVKIRDFFGYIAIIKMINNVSFSYDSILFST